MKRSAREATQTVATAALRQGQEEKQEKILRARPVAGEVDHEALTREIIARFPKILAALAE